MKNPNVSSTLSDAQDLRTGYFWTEVRKLGKKYKKFNWSSVEVLLNFIYTYDVLMDHFSKWMSVHGLSPAVFNVLMILSRSSGKKLKQHEISKLLLVSRANVTGLVNTLVRKGLAKREPDEKDRRAWRITITGKGKTLLETYLPHHYAEVSRIFLGFSQTEKKKLNRLICKFKQGVAK
jgi:DNA-binding MarR family transcriptional regulator